MESDVGVWSHTLQDGLGSVRGVVSDASAVQESRLYAPYGEPFGITGTQQTDFGFTGEQTDGNHQVFLRARYYNPAIGVFNSLDPFEGSPSRPMSLNGYSWVEGNVVNMVDPSGSQGEVVFPLLPDSDNITTIGTNFTPFVPNSESINEGDFSSFQLQTQVDVLNGGICLSGFNFGDNQQDIEFDLSQISQPNSGAGVLSPPGGMPPLGGEIPDWLRIILAAMAAGSAAWWLARTIPRVIPRTDTRGECPKLRGTINPNVSWNRAIFVPDVFTRPLDLIVSFGQGVPPFHAGQPSVSKFDVECIATAIRMGFWVGVGGSTQPISFEQITSLSRAEERRGVRTGQWVLTDGHTRFVASLLASIPLSVFNPEWLNFRGFITSIWPWELVEWDNN